MKDAKTANPLLLRGLERGSGTAGWCQHHQNVDVELGRGFKLRNGLQSKPVVNGRTVSVVLTNSAGLMSFSKQ